MNLGKSEVKFNPNMEVDLKQSHGLTLQSQVVTKLGKYLESFVNGPNRDRDNYKLILDHLNLKLQGWMANLVSQAARGLHVISWGKVCRLKEMGGLCIRKFEPLNRALLGAIFVGVLVMELVLALTNPTDSLVIITTTPTSDCKISHGMVGSGIGTS
ncbi:putative ribonuclease H protein [Senna tora]|uniref:Putative ribonuclease H protein n=1 Tax=Senna tora TaxID=362788 RepID=A0A834X7U0_9FABA|nr:putative ribonuclease H protein [Senna tora]